MRKKPVELNRNSVYDKSRDLRGELDRLAREEFPDDIKSAITRFVHYLKVQGLGEHRQYFYSVRLRMIARLMGKSFLNPTKQDIEDLVIAIGKKGYTYNTEDDFKRSAKRFYQWSSGEDGESPDFLKGLKIHNSDRSRIVKPEPIISKEELKGMVDACNQPRDRALVSLLYDSGCRISEILTLRIEDLMFDSYGLVLMVAGKTGPRRVRVVGDSIPYLRQWLEVHPSGRDRSSYVFQGIERKARGRMMNYPQAAKVIKSAALRAGIKRSIHPHLFRHTRATLLAGSVPEAPLELQMGWVHGSGQTRTYVHLSGGDQDRAILKSYGIKVKEDQPVDELPRECARCKTLNTSAATYCKNCWLPFDTRLAIEMEEKEKQIGAFIQSSTAVDPLAKSILRSAPESVKAGLLESVLSEILKNPQLRDKFVEELRARQS